MVALRGLISMAQMYTFAAGVRCPEKRGWRWILGSLAVACATQAMLDVILCLVIGGRSGEPFTLSDFFSGRQWQSMPP